jgi:phosphopantothenoylcysteine decarboxylase/phosphopantothenate--cysteine ligase
VRRRILVTSGPTREPLDPVRYISNASSGRQGHAIAAEAARRGYEVDLVSGPVSIEAPSGKNLHFYPVETAVEMFDVVQSLHPACDVFVAAAAVSDFRPDRRLEHKHKRGAAESWVLTLVPNPDIAAKVGKSKGDRVHIGFALETDDGISNARRKLEAKRFDWIILNDPGAIDAAEGMYTLLALDGPPVSLGTRSKDEIATLILDLAESRSQGRRP